MEVIMLARTQTHNPACMYVLEGVCVCVCVCVCVRVCHTVYR